jgi:hypothetical protein
MMPKKAKTESENIKTEHRCNMQYFDRCTIQMIATQTSDSLNISDRIINVKLQDYVVELEVALLYEDGFKYDGLPNKIHHIVFEPFQLDNTPLPPSANILGYFNLSLLDSWYTVSEKGPFVKVYKFGVKK